MDYQVLDSVFLSLVLGYNVKGFNEGKYIHELCGRAGLSSVVGLSGLDVGGPGAKGNLKLLTDFRCHKPWFGSYCVSQAAQTWV